VVAQVLDVGPHAQAGVDVLGPETGALAKRSRHERSELRETHADSERERHRGRGKAAPHAWPGMAPEPGDRDESTASHGDHEVLRRMPAPDHAKQRGHHERVAPALLADKGVPQPLAEDEESPDGEDQVGVADESQRAAVVEDHHVDPGHGDVAEHHHEGHGGTRQRREAEGAKEAEHQGGEESHRHRDPRHSATSGLQVPSNRCRLARMDCTAFWASHGTRSWSTMKSA
jgi:hypothetical protein